MDKEKLDTIAKKYLDSVYHIAVQFYKGFPSVQMVKKYFVTDADGNEHQIERYDENAGYTAGLAIPTPKVANPDD